MSWTRRKRKRTRVNSHIIAFAVLCCLLPEQFLVAATLPSQSLSLEDAYIRADGESLKVGNSRLEQSWTLTSAGLVTTGVQDKVAGKTWQDLGPACQSDWSLPWQTNEVRTGRLTSLDLTEGNDEGFTSEYLEALATFEYEASQLAVRYRIWIYPSAPGLRTQLEAKGLSGYRPPANPAPATMKYYGHTLPVKTGRTVYLPISSAENQRRYWGYYNDPGARNKASSHMLREELVSGPAWFEEHVDWASGVNFENGDNGLCLIKESHKAVNQPGHLTGSYFCSPSGVESTGWGLSADEIRTNGFRQCWANWIIVNHGGNDGLQLAVKLFDRARYPVRLEADLLIIADTWGNSNPDGRPLACEQEVLKEIPAVADLGIDVLRIDDGWQGSGTFGDDWCVSKQHYSNGWRSVKQLADRHGVKLGLWANVRKIPLADMKWHYDRIGVATWKLDFDLLDSRAAIEERMQKIRELELYANRRTQVAWCPEYNHARYGWYWAREYGSLYFQNVQQRMPRHLIYQPFISLRGNWEIGRYFNLNKLQTPIQNIDLVDPTMSDAVRHNHPYAVAIGLAGTPLFFTMVNAYTPEARDQIRPLVDVYKAHREQIFTSYMFPIGDEPDNRSWSGFQAYHPDRGEGYLLLFRELNNTEPRRRIRLKFLRNAILECEDLVRGRTWSADVDAEGEAQFEIEQSAGFLFLKTRRQP